MTSPNLAFLFVGLSALTLTACRPPAVIPAPESPVTVSLHEVKASDWVPTLPLAGRVRDPGLSEVQARLAGTVRADGLALGRRYAAGETILLIESPEIEARVAQAQARLAQAERDLSREQRLLAQGVTPQETVLALAEGERAARAAWQEAQAFLNFTRLTAPSSGRIARHYVNSGDSVQPGQPLFTWAADSASQIEVEVPARLLNDPLPTTVTVQDGTRTFAASIVEVAPAESSRTSSRTVRLSTKVDSSYPSGHYVEVRWPLPVVSAHRIPLSAVRSFGEIDSVYLDRSGRAELRVIRLGGSEGTHVRVVAGLVAGDKVVLEPGRITREGQALQATP